MSFWEISITSLGRDPFGRQPGVSLQASFKHNMYLDLCMSMDSLGVSHSLGFPSYVSVNKQSDDNPVFPGRFSLLKHDVTSSVNLHY